MLFELRKLDFPRRPQKVQKLRSTNGCLLILVNVFRELQLFLLDKETEKSILNNDEIFAKTEKLLEFKGVSKEQQSFSTIFPPLNVPNRKNVTWIQNY